MSFILIEFTYYFKHIFIQYISVHLYKGPNFIPDRGPKITSPPLDVNLKDIMYQFNSAQGNPIFVLCSPCFGLSTKKCKIYTLYASGLVFF